MEAFKEKVVLYSGGMDSFILGKMYPGALKLYVNTNSRYSEKEISYLESDVLIHNGIDLSCFEREDSVVPCRNMYLALVASNYGNEIMLGATAGDQNEDNSELFANLASTTIGYLLSGAAFQPRKIKVSLPIRALTKIELVNWYINRFKGDEFELAESVSCYSQLYKHCGVCKSCRRKWLALAYHGIDYTVWHTHPADAEWPLEESGKWYNSPKERGMIETVFNRFGIKL